MNNACLKQKLRSSPNGLRLQALQLIAYAFHEKSVFCDKCGMLLLTVQLLFSLECISVRSIQIQFGFGLSTFMHMQLQPFDEFYMNLIL